MAGGGGGSGAGENPGARWGSGGRGEGTTGGTPPGDWSHWVPGQPTAPPPGVRENYNNTQSITQSIQSISILFMRVYVCVCI